MRVDRIKSLLRKQPFRPIKLSLTDGRNIDIRHPEQVLVTARDLFIAVSSRPASRKRIATPSTGDEFAEDWIIVDAIHVVAAEPANGARRD